MNDFVGNTICMVCGKIACILINKRLRPIPPEIDKHVDPNNPFCNECLETMKTGTFLISVRDGEGDKPESAKNPYRTGRLCVIKAEAARRMFEGKKPPLAFIEDKMWVEMGLPMGDEDHTNPASAKDDWLVAICQKCGTTRGVRPDWRSQNQHAEIKARCLTCQPAQTDTEYEMFPHKIEKYQTFKPHASKDQPTEESPEDAADQKAGSADGAAQVPPEA